MSPVRFLVERDLPPTGGKLVYSRTDLSFAFEMSAPRASDLFSLAMGTLQLDVIMNSGLVLYPWGYWPYPAWSAGAVVVPADRVVAAVRADLLEGLPPRGAGVGLPGGSLFTTYDQDSGWIQISRQLKPTSGASAVEFAANCIMQISNEELVGLFLHPEYAQ
jgi:hypothetical protein